MAKYLYGASVQGIQEFIFATNELKSIIGASEIIKDINEQIKKQYEKNIVVNAAGNVKLLFDESQKDVLEDLVENFPKQVMQNAYGISISQAVEKFEEGELKDAFEKLEKKLFIQRNRPSIPLDMSINILKLARKTAKPSVEKEKDMATLQKETMAHKKNMTGNIPKNRKNKTAIIHADGNGLGAIIATFSNDTKNDNELIKKYEDFSTNLEKATNNAFDEATKEINDGEIRKVILGGDDVTIICNANVALEFTNKFLKAFEEQTKNLLGEDGLTACAGIAYCNHKYPFHYAVNLAESLCAYSKKHSREIVKDSKKLAPSSLMFHNIQSSNFVNFDEYIDKELTLNKGKDKVHLNYGPYFVNRQDKYSTIDSFNLLANAFKQKDSPISRLREWLTMLGQNSVQAKERLKRINQMIELRDDIFKKKALENCMRIFNQEILLEDLTYERDAMKFTPIGDVNNYLSVIDYEKEEKKVECNV